jgi:hypothetical protein
LGWRSLSLDAILWNSIGSFRSLDGVVASGVGGSRSLSWLGAPGTVSPAWELDGAVDVEIDVADSSGGVATSSTAAGGDTVVVAGGATGVRGATCVSFRDANLPDCSAGDFLDGTVLLRVSPPVGVDVNAGLPGLGQPLEWKDRLEEVDLCLRIEPSLATLSAPALAVDADRTMPDFAVGVDGGLSTGVPFCTSSTVFSSAAVPCIPMRK